MSSSAFKRALAATKESKNLDKVLVGSSYIAEVTNHPVVIQAIDTSRVSDDMLNVTYIDDAGKTFTDRLFLMNREKTDFSYGIRSLWSAVIPDKDALGKFFEILEADPTAYEMFTGMKVKVTTRPGTGYIVKATGTGTFAAYNVDKKGVVDDKPVTAEFETIDDVRADAEAQNLDRSYLRMTKVESREKEANLKAFNDAVEARAKAAANGGVTASTFAAGKVV